MKAVQPPISSPLLLLLLHLWPLCIWGRCIFDQVQSSVRVVSSPILQPNPYDWPLNEAMVKQQVPVISVGRDDLTLQTTQRSQDATSRHPQSLRIRRMEKGWIKALQPQPIRIKTWTSRESPVLSHWERERVEAAVSEAISTVSKLLSVRRVPDRLLLNRDINKYCRFIWRNSSTYNYNRCGRANEKYRAESCLGVTIPDDHLSGYIVYPHPDQPNSQVLKPDGLGVPDTDFLLYMHTQSTAKCRADSSVLAYSVHCQTDADGRPIVGVVVICRESLRVDGFSHERMVQTVIHELFHMLGFSKDLYGTWRDCSLSSQSQLGVGCSSRGHVTNTDETGQMRIYSPNVIKTLHTHLNSTHTELGAPLENQDVGSGGVSSHWEARVLQGSIMMAALGEPSLFQIDRVTLSALQDTGWYTVNFSQAQSLLWGEGEGDLFGSLATCNESSSFFCTGSGLGCHYLHLHKGECQSDEYLEGCRIYKPLANRSECWKEENERKSELENWSGEIYHTDSRCFLSSLIREDHSSHSVSVVGHCYRHRCTGRNMYQIQVGGSDWLDCPAGKSIEVLGYRGTVFCPDRRFCHHHNVNPPASTHKPLLPAQLSTAATFSKRNHTPQPMISNSSLNFKPALPFSTSALKAGMIVASVLVIANVLFLLAVLIIIYRKCCSARVRVHAFIETPHVLQLQAT
ncbi:ciliated left-right organizer metallopeptidase [Salminus brasiliensis]|uniref:ciliated left-right organizer metallopeptidase n=1 Tax=Salminus brasiliensis TaxID=930266 RepID=UPI003B833681